MTSDITWSLRTELRRGRFRKISHLGQKFSLFEAFSSSISLGKCSASALAFLGCLQRESSGILCGNSSWFSSESKAVSCWKPFPLHHDKLFSTIFFVSDPRAQSGLRSTQSTQFLTLGLFASDLIQLWTINPDLPCGTNLRDLGVRTA